MNFLKRMFVSVVSFINGPTAEKVARNVHDYAQKALPIVGAIAALTPTRSDDELVALFNRYAQPNVEKFLALPPQNRGLALLHIATAELSKQAPMASNTALQTAVQLAVLALKAGV